MITQKPLTPEEKEDFQKKKEQEFAEFVKTFNKEMKSLEQLYKRYQKESSDNTPIPEDHFSLFIEWALHSHEYYDRDLHTGQYDSKIILNNKNCYKATSKDNFFKSYSADFLNYVWPVRYTSMPIF